MIAKWLIMIKEWFRKHWKLITSVILNIVLCLCLFSTCQRPEPKVIVKEIKVHDTIEVPQEKIIEKTKIKEITHLDTFYISNTDTIFIKDFPIEYKRYDDVIVTDSTTTEISIDFHGFNADLDSIRFVNHYTITNTIEKKQAPRLGLDVVVGPSIGYDFRSGYYVGAGVTIGLGYRITR